MYGEMEFRFEAFRYLASLERLGTLIPGRVLAQGFHWKGVQVTLKGQTGIWTPKGFSCPISITSRTQGLYDLDAIAKDGIITYAYRGTDPNHRDNVLLRRAYENQTPLIFFKEILKHHYQAIWPVVIFEDNPRRLCVRATVEPAYRNLSPAVSWDHIRVSSADVRQYATVQTRQRLHQSAFRELVINAYDERCAMCNLHHRQLLDAAHIVPDSEDDGIPVVQNGLSLCKIHHAAFDCNLLGIDPDYVIHVDKHILSEHDGPMLQHGLKELEHQRLILPRKRNDWPDQAFLERKFAQFSD